MVVHSRFLGSEASAAGFRITVPGVGGAAFGKHANVIDVAQFGCNRAATS